MTEMNRTPTSLLPLCVDALDLGYGDSLVQRNLTFDIRKGSIFAVMGPSGCGKSTLMKALIGLHRPHAGRVAYGDTDFWSVPETKQTRLMRHIGVLYQHGALLSSHTLAGNVAIPLGEYTAFSAEEIYEIADMKLAMVGLHGFAERKPSDVSGGMQKRVALARAMALDPSILFLDEPSAGLDPINARHLDELILELADALDTTVVLVTHELASIFAVADDGVFLDTESGTLVGRGSPGELLRHNDHPVVQEFLTRGDPAKQSTHPSKGKPSS